MEVGRKESGTVSWTHEREAKLHCLFLRSFFETFFWNLVSDNSEFFFLPSAVGRSSEFFAMFSFFFFVRFFFFRRVLRKNFALRYLDSVKPFSFVWPSPILFLGRNCNGTKKPARCECGVSPGRERSRFVTAWRYFKPGGPTQRF